MAGLGAARVLADGGAKVTVIEARDRIGGRTHTSHIWPDLPVDLGASWIHGVTGNPLTVLADQIGAARTLSPYDRWATFDATGRLLDVSDLETRTFALMDKARDLVDDHDRDTSLKDAIEGLPDWAALAPEDPRPLEAMPDKGCAPGHRVMFHMSMADRGIHLHDGGIVVEARALGGSDVAAGDVEGRHGDLQKERPPKGGHVSCNSRCCLGRP
jgi:monoamine oxidase